MRGLIDYLAAMLLISALFVVLGLTVLPIVPDAPQQDKTEQR